MGNLYGPEYWTYLVPCRAGDANARPVSHPRLPMEAFRLPLLDRMPNSTPFAIADLAHQLATDPALDARLAEKRRCRDADQAAKPPAACREEGPARARHNFCGFDPSYHGARHNFIQKLARWRILLALRLRRRAMAKPPRTPHSL
jgi:putative two-component system protein, hydrogenase maturation factor HypX/HoxX